MRTLIKALLENANDNVLMMSLKNCHVVGVDSIVLNMGDKGALIRIFIANENHELYNNQLLGNMSVGFHNHKRDLNLVRIYGTVYNVVPTLSPVSEGHYYECDFSSAIHNKDKKWTINKSSKQYIVNTLRMDIINSIYLNHNELHTIFVPGNKEAAWMVIEDKNKFSETTRLITNNLKSLDHNNNLYMPFNDQYEVKEYLYEKFKL